MFISFFFLRRKKKETNQRKKNTPLLGWEQASLAINFPPRELATAQTHSAIMLRISNTVTVVTVCVHILFFFIFTPAVKEMGHSIYDKLKITLLSKIFLNFSTDNIRYVQQI